MGRSDRNRYLIQPLTNRCEEKSGSWLWFQEYLRYFELLMKFPLNDSNTKTITTKLGLVYARNQSHLFKLCKKPLTMGESYQEFFLDHAGVFEL